MGIGLTALIAVFTYPTIPVAMTVKHTIEAQGDATTSSSLARIYMERHPDEQVRYVSIACGESIYTPVSEQPIAASLAPSPETCLTVVGNLSNYELRAYSIATADPTIYSHTSLYFDQATLGMN